MSNPDTGDKSLVSTVTSTSTGSNCAAGSTDSRCSNTIPVSILTMAVTATPLTTAPGATVNYTISVTNSGTVAVSGAALTDSLSGVLDDASYNGDASATAGSVSYYEPEPDLDREPRRRGGEPRSRSRSRSATPIPGTRS